MTTASVRQLRNDYAALLREVGRGKRIAITRRGRTVALLTPPPAPDTVDWTQSAALRRDKGKMKTISAKQSAALIAEAGGKW